MISGILTLSQTFKNSLYSFKHQKIDRLFMNLKKNTSLKFVKAMEQFGPISIEG